MKTAQKGAFQNAAHLGASPEEPTIRAQSDQLMFASAASDFSASDAGKKSYFSALARGGIHTAVNFSPYKDQSPLIVNQNTSNSSNSKPPTVPNRDSNKENIYYESSNYQHQKTTPAQAFSPGSANKLAKLISGSNLQPLEEEVSKEEEDSTFVNFRQAAEQQVKTETQQSRNIGGTTERLNSNSGFQLSDLTLSSANFNQRMEEFYVSNIEGAASINGSASGFGPNPLQTHSYSDHVDQFTPIVALSTDFRSQENTSRYTNDSVGTPSQPRPPCEDLILITSTSNPSPKVLVTTEQTPDHLKMFDQTQKQKAKDLLENLKNQNSNKSQAQSPPVETRLFEQYKEQMERKEQQKTMREQEQMKEVRQVPQISVKSQELIQKKQLQMSLSGQGVPLPTYMVDHSQLYEEKLKREAELTQLQNQKEMEGFTGKPTINKKSKQIQRSTQDLLAWQNKQKLKLEEEQKKKILEEQMNIQKLQHQRVVNKSSEKMLEQNQRFKGRWEERLARDAKLRQNKASSLDRMQSRSKSKSKTRSKALSPVMSQPLLSPQFNPAAAHTMSQQETAAKGGSQTHRVLINQINSADLVQQNHNGNGMMTSGLAQQWDQFFKQQQQQQMNVTSYSQPTGNKQSFSGIFSPENMNHTAQFQTFQSALDLAPTLASTTSAQAAAVNLPTTAATMKKDAFHYNPQQQQQSQKKEKPGAKKGANTGQKVQYESLFSKVQRMNKSSHNQVEQGTPFSPGSQKADGESNKSTPNHLIQANMQSLPIGVSTDKGLHSASYDLANQKHQQFLNTMPLPPAPARQQIDNTRNHMHLVLRTNAQSSTSSETPVFSVKDGMDQAFGNMFLESRKSKHQERQDMVINKILENSFIPNGSARENRKDLEHNSLDLLLAQSRFEAELVHEKDSSKNSDKEIVKNLRNYLETVDQPKNKEPRSTSENGSSRINNFIDRNRDWAEQKQSKIKQKKTAFEIEEEKICTFKPRIQSKNTKPVVNQTKKKGVKPTLGRKPANFNSSQQKASPPRPELREAELQCNLIQPYSAGSHFDSKNSTDSQKSETALAITSMFTSQQQQSSQQLLNPSAAGAQDLQVVYTAEDASLPMEAHEDISDVLLNSNQSMNTTDLSIGMSDEFEKHEIKVQHVQPKKFGQF